MNASSTCLAFDATNRWTTMGVFGPGISESLLNDAPRESFRHFAPMLAQLVGKERGVVPDWIVTTKGPGSFTGVRLSVGTARNLSQFWQIPILGIDSLTLYVQEVRTLGLGQPLVVMIDGKQERVYAKTILPEQDLRQTQAASCADIAPGPLMESAPKDALFFADDPAAVRAYLVRSGAGFADTPIEPIPPPRAKTLWEIGITLKHHIELVTWREFVPNYLRNDPAHAKFPQGFKDKTK